MADVYPWQKFTDGIRIVNLNQDILSTERERLIKINAFNERNWKYCIELSSTATPDMIASCNHHIATFVARFKNVMKKYFPRTCSDNDQNYLSVKNVTECMMQISSTGEYNYLWDNILYIENEKTEKTILKIPFSKTWIYEFRRKHYKNSVEDLSQMSFILNSIYMIHPDHFNFVCDFCAMNFETEQLFIKHLKTFHLKEKIISSRRSPLLHYSPDDHGLLEVALTIRPFNKNSKQKHTTESKIFSVADVASLLDRINYIGSDMMEILERVANLIPKKQVETFNNIVSNFDPMVKTGEIINLFVERIQMSRQEIKDCENRMNKEEEDFKNFIDLTDVDTESWNTLPPLPLSNHEYTAVKMEMTDETCIFSMLEMCDPDFNPTDLLLTN